MNLFSITAALLCLAACNGSDNGGSTSIQSPGRQPVQSGGKDLTTQCDTLRERGRHDTLQALGIDMLEEGSDQILSQLSSDDYQMIEEDAQTGTPESLQKIDKIITDATQAAGLDWTQLQLGAETHRKLLLGSPDYLDKQGNFSVGSTTVIDESTLKAGAAYNVYLVVGTSSASQYTIEIEIVSSMQRDADGSIVTETVSMLDYVEGSLLPAMCAGVPSDLDGSNFNTIPVSTLVRGNP